MGRSMLRPYWSGAGGVGKRAYQVTRTRYLRVEVAFLSTGTWNWAAQAEVLVEAEEMA